MRTGSSRLAAIHENFPCPCRFASRSIVDTVEAAENHAISAVTTTHIPNTRSPPDRHSRFT